MPVPTIPQPVLNALNQLQISADDRSAKKDVQTTRIGLLADAQAAKDTADSEVVAAEAQVAADKQALVDLLTSTYPT